MSKFVIGSAVKEIRFHLSQAAESSTALRSFITSSYPTLSKANPELPILIREASFARPTVFVRFEKGQEVKKSLEGLDKTQIETEIKNLLGF
ncbi:CYFA0S02e11298g1_1 [Cyberlindnera fabianii]|uniref:CYFA0S02e11298g1_1 n=1 Tax=Cyberlindnera fabianii TaxID=36022 RepID=A0A061ANE5_CYBFA|nr:CYFA0S02e11298g1_1 [Cyberlindnera fabianii]